MFYCIQICITTYLFQCHSPWTMLRSWALPLLLCWNMLMLIDSSSKFSPIRSSRPISRCLHHPLLRQCLFSSSNSSSCWLTPSSCHSSRSNYCSTCSANQASNSSCKCSRFPNRYSFISILSIMTCLNIIKMTMCSLHC